MNLNKLVTIQRRAKSQDATGQLKETWQNAGQVWASIRPASAAELNGASGARAEITHNIIVRYGPKLRPHDRIELDGRVFEIIAPMNVGEQNRYLKLMSKERADDFGI